MAYELLSLREGPAVNESRNDSVGHPCLSLLVLAISVEQFSGENGGLLAFSVKCLESANESVRVIPKADGTNGHSAPHRESYLLVSPATLVKVRMQKRD